MKPRRILITDAQLAKIAHTLANHFGADSNERTERIDIRALENALVDAHVNSILETRVEPAQIITPDTEVLV